MFDNDVPHSKELEKEVLGGLLNNPKAFPEVDAILTTEDFYSKENYYIYFGLTQVVSDYVESGQKINAAILHDKVSSVFSDKRGLDLLEYIRDLQFCTASTEDTIKAAVGLAKFTFKRDMQKKLRESHKLLLEEDSIDKITSDIYENVTSVEKMYGCSNQPVNVTVNNNDRI